MVKDRLFGFRLAYGINLNLFGYEISEKFKDPERFDIVIFKYPDDESRLFIKRVIGLRERQWKFKDGKVYIDGSPTPLDDSFIPEKMIGSYGPYTVPENSYFMLGDNRNDSKDSRSWKNKFVRFDQLVGESYCKILSIFQVVRIIRNANISGLLSTGIFAFFYLISLRLYIFKYM